MKGIASFPTQMRIHMGLRVKNLKASIAFYQKMFDVTPAKVRKGYAKFEVVEPPVNLTLNVSADGPCGNPNVSHFGVQVKDTEAVATAQKRLETAGLKTRTEEATNCCHSIQDKAWVADPDGNEWEFFVVLEDSVPEANGAACCF